MWKSPEIEGPCFMGQELVFGTFSASFWLFENELYV